MSSIGGGTGPIGDSHPPHSPRAPLKLPTSDEDEEVDPSASDDEVEVDVRDLVDVSISPVTLSPTDEMNSNLTLVQSQLQRVSNLMNAARMEKRVDKYEMASTSFDLTQQLASSISSGASIVTSSPSPVTQNLFVVSTSISSALGTFFTIVTFREALALKDLITLKEQTLAKSTKKEFENELRREIIDLKEQNLTLLGMATIGAIDSGASTSAFGIQLSGSSVQSAVMAANVLGAVASLAGVAASSYQLYKNQEKFESLAKKMQQADELYQMIEDADPITKDFVEDICLLRDSNLTLQRNDLVVSTVQNGLILTGSLLGLAQSLAIIFVGSSTLLITGLGIGAVIGIGIGVSIGMSYYAYKKRRLLQNKFSKLLNHASNDPKKLALLEKEATHLSALEKFDASATLINRKIEKIQMEMKKIRQKMNGLENQEQLLKKEQALQLELETLTKRQGISVEERLKGINAKLAEVISSQKGHEVIYNILLKLGVPSAEIEVADMNHMMNQLHKALVS